MPLTDLVRYLNTRDREQRPFPTLADPFQAIPEGAVARYARITLSSRFAPIRSTSSARIHGHSAVLEARGELNGQTLHPDAVFAIPGNNAEFIHLDRLVRTLHALNYLLHPGAQRLYLKVNYRHVVSVATGHGIAFENALKACGLLPEHITLEISVDSRSPHDKLRAAIDGYRERGYNIAIAPSDFPTAWEESTWLRPLAPDVVRLDSRLLRTPKRLADIAHTLREYGIRSLVEVHNEETQSERARAAGVDFVQAQVTQVSPTALNKTNRSHLNAAA